MAKASETFEESTDLALMVGGPLFQLLRRAHLSGDALELIGRRIVFIPLVAWLPLFLLSAWSGLLVPGSTTVPFLLDVAIHARLLVVIPLLILAELVVHERIRPVVREFRARNLVREEDRARFDAAVESTVRWRNSVVAEVILVVMAYSFVQFVAWPYYRSIAMASWSQVPAGSGFEVTPAALWFRFVSLPIFQFLFLRWYFRILVWTRFLFRLSRIDLALLPTHPDGVGGLSFLSATAHAFVPLAAAHGALLSGLIANRIFHLGKSLPQFKIEIAALVAWVLVLVFGPLLVFVGQLARARRVGMREYGRLAERYMRGFDEKWLRGGAPPTRSWWGAGTSSRSRTWGGASSWSRG